MTAIGRIGTHMRSAKQRIVLERPSSINATISRGPQQEGSRADRHGVHKTPRRPFSRGSLICIIIGHSGKPQHTHRTDWAPRPSLLQRAHISEHHVHDTTTARLTTNGAQCQNRTKHPTIQPSENPQMIGGQASKNKPIHNSKYLPPITGHEQENVDTYWHHNNKIEHKHRYDAHHRGRTR